MPNLKIHVNDDIHGAISPALRAELPTLRKLICEDLAVPPSACQFAVISVIGMDDLPKIAVELQILPKPERTPELVNTLARRIRAVLGPVTEQHVAVRITIIDPTRYIALK